jgi:MOSC domain
MTHRSDAELAAGLDGIRRSPATDGTVELIVRRPGEDEREVLVEGQLTPVDGLVGDHWRARGSRSMPDGSADPERQLTLMNARVVDLLANGDRSAWAQAGDQLYLDLDLSTANLPAGTRLAIGGAVVEVSAPPHTGCAKFGARFGSAALRFVNTPEGRALRLRGLNARVIEAGTVRQGDLVRRL